MFYNLKMKGVILDIFLFLIFSLSFASVALADTQILKGHGECEPTDCKGVNELTKTVSGCEQYCGDYQVNGFLSLVVRISEIILVVVGSLSLLAFVAGGFMFLLSSGNPSLVSKGKATIIGAVIGLLLVLFSYTIVSFVSGFFLSSSFDSDIFSTN